MHFYISPIFYTRKCTLSPRRMKILRRGVTLCLKPILCPFFSVASQAWGDENKGVENEKQRFRSN